MNSPTAPPPHDPDPDVRDAGRCVAPTADGVAPAPSTAGWIDWSSDAASAAIGTLVETLATIDRLAVQAVDSLVRIIDLGATEAVLGVAPELVLSQTCRATGLDRTDLLRAATTLPRMPATFDALRRGDVSWSQVRTICHHIKRLNVDGRSQVDGLVSRLAPGYVDVEADALVFEVEWLVAQLQTERDADRDTRPVEHNRVSFAPRLDGSGTMIADYDATHFPLMTDRIDTIAGDSFALDPAPGPPTAGRCERSEQLQRDRRSRAHRQAAKLAGRNAARRANALFELVTGRRADTLEPTGDAVATGRASVLLTCPVDTLLDPGCSTSAWVLTTLTGRMRVTSAVARRWIDRHGADLRTIVLDDIGQVVGVGRKTRRPPGWLRDAIIARDLGRGDGTVTAFGRAGITAGRVPTRSQADPACNARRSLPSAHQPALDARPAPTPRPRATAPCSTTPGLLCDVDHVTGWADGGRTDVDNLTLLSSRWNRHKHDRWQHTRHADGTTTWTAKPSGWTTRTVPPPHLPTLFDPDPPASDPPHAAVATTPRGRPVDDRPPKPRGP